MDRLSRVLEQPVFSRAEIRYLLSLEEEAEREQLRAAAFDLTTRLVGDGVFLRGIVEFSNVCARNCYYCGLRRDNIELKRYRLSRGETVAAALWCAEAGYGSCILQSGERSDPAFTRFVTDCVREIKEKSRGPSLPGGLGITLSVGEQRPEVYRRFRAAGAHRYLLRIETSNPGLFARLHPGDQRHETRLACLDALRDAGFQVGTGVMIGLPGQTIADLADDILFFAARDIDMIGMGPYIVHRNAPLSSRGMLGPGRLMELALNMISVTRLVLRDVNIAATTALQVLAHDGRERGIMAGANVVMPNVTPGRVRRHYQIYEGKPCLTEGPDECRDCFRRRIAATGRVVGLNDWGDSRHYAARTGVRPGAGPSLPLN